MTGSKNSIVFALIMCIGAASIAQTPTHSANSNLPLPSGAKADTADVQHVIDAYHEAVHTHDAARLSGLFLPQASLWLSVLADDAYARTRETKPDAQKVRVGSYTDFAKLISNPKVNFNPTQTDVQIHSDGTIASVYFHFIFLIDGKEQNRGNETWVLVKGTDGWRIAAIVYSSEPHTP